MTAEVAIEQYIDASIELILAEVIGPKPMRAHWNG